jgi:hypothetical protein
VRRPQAIILQNPLLGWVPLSGVLEPGDTVKAYAVRLQIVRGVCHTQACNRRLKIDPAELCEKGFGQLMMRQVKDLARCNHIDHCALTFHNDKPDNPLRLAHLLGRPNVRIRIACAGKDCRHFRVWRAAELIAALKTREAGGDLTEVTALAGLMKAPCPVCKRRSWRVDILWKDTDAAGWRQQGEAIFNDVGPPT